MERVGIERDIRRIEARKVQKLKKQISKSFTQPFTIIA
jgi:hypothetical protein